MTEPATQQTAQQESDDTYRTIHYTISHIVHRQTSLGQGTLQEEGYDFGQKPLRQAEQQYESQCRNDVRLAENT